MLLLLKAEVLSSRSFPGAKAKCGSVIRLRIRRGLFSHDNVCALFIERVDALFGKLDD